MKKIIISTGLPILFASLTPGCGSNVENKRKPKIERITETKVIHSKERELILQKEIEKLQKEVTELDDKMKDNLLKQVADKQDLTDTLATYKNLYTSITAYFPQDTADKITETISEIDKFINNDKSAIFTVILNKIRETNASLSDLIKNLNDSKSKSQKAQADLNKAQADLTKSQDDLAKAQADLNKAQADLAKAQADLTKSQNDLTKSQADLAKAQADLTKSQADLNKAQADLNKAQADLNKAQADLNKAQADLIKSQDDLAKTNTKLKEANDKLDKIITSINTNLNSNSRNQINSSDLNNLPTLNNKISSKIEEKLFDRIKLAIDDYNKNKSDDNKIKLGVQVNNFDAAVNSIFAHFDKKIAEKTTQCEYCTSALQQCMQDKDKLIKKVTELENKIKELELIESNNLSSVEGCSTEKSSDISIFTHYARFEYNPDPRNPVIDRTRVPTVVTSGMLIPDVDSLNSLRTGNSALKRSEKSIDKCLTVRDINFENGGFTDKYSASSIFYFKTMFLDSHSDPSSFEEKTTNLVDLVHISNNNRINYSIEEENYYFHKYTYDENLDYKTFNFNSSPRKSSNENKTYLVFSKYHNSSIFFSENVNGHYVNFSNHYYFYVKNKITGKNEMKITFNKKPIENGNKIEIKTCFKAKIKDKLVDKCFITKMNNLPIKQTFEAYKY